MLESNNLVTFEGLANSSGYHTFLLDEEKGRLVVGAKDHIFSFNLLNISKDFAQVKPNIHMPMTAKSDCVWPALIPAFSVCISTQCQSGAHVSQDSLYCF